MNKRTLGRTHLEISELGLNTRRFGYSAEETASALLLDAYYELGGRFIQVVGGRPPPGDTEDPRAEELVGAWLRTSDVRRDDLVIAARLRFDRPAVGGCVAFSDLVRQNCRDTLRRLGTTHLDLLVCEWHPALGPVEDLLETVTLLVRAGMVRYAVAGGFSTWRVVDSIHRARGRGHCRFEAVQEDYSLLSGMRFVDDTLTMCDEHKLGLIARAPLDGGIAARIRPRSDHPAGRLPAALAAVADIRGTTPARVALAWTLSHPQVTSALLTATTVAQLRSQVASARLALSSFEIGKLNAAAARHRLADLSLAV